MDIDDTQKYTHDIAFSSNARMCWLCAGEGKLLQSQAKCPLCGGIGDLAHVHPFISDITRTIFDKTGYGISGHVDDMRKHALFCLKSVYDRSLIAVYENQVEKDIFAKRILDICYFLYILAQCEKKYGKCNIFLKENDEIPDFPDFCLARLQLQKSRKNLNTWFGYFFQSVNKGDYDAAYSRLETIIPLLENQLAITSKNAAETFDPDILVLLTHGIEYVNYIKKKKEEELARKAAEERRKREQEEAKQAEIRRRKEELEKEKKQISLQKRLGEILLQINKQIEILQQRRAVVVICGFIFSLAIYIFVFWIFAELIHKDGAPIMFFCFVLIGLLSFFFIIVPCSHIIAEIKLKISALNRVQTSIREYMKTQIGKEELEHLKRCYDYDLSRFNIQLPVWEED